MNSTILKNKIEEINEKKEEIPKVQMKPPVKIQTKEEPKKEEIKEVQKDIFVEETVESFPDVDKFEEPELQPVAGVEAEGEETEEESEED
jgi:hypothetical protein